jgi:hypothetical protein
MVYLLESSRVPIYDRIARAIASSMRAMGATVYYADTSAFSDAAFVETINKLSIDCYISTNEHNKIQEFSETLGCHLFELVEKAVIFIHHDNLCSAFTDAAYIARKLNAYSSINDRSAHFVLESSNIEVLTGCGISRCFIIPHASEYSANGPDANCHHGVSFVGHLMASLKEYPSSGLMGAPHLESLAWSRLSRSSYPIQPRLREIITDRIIRDRMETSDLPDFAVAQALIANLNKLSSAFRGQLLSLVQDIPLAIIGGDLSYGRIHSPLLKLDRPNVKYLPATTDYADTASVYRSTRVSINISALQFDTSVNNRVIDIVMAGGFVLTDRRTDLSALTECHSEISFDTPEEFVDKIEFFSHPSNDRRYQEVKRQVFSDVARSRTYDIALAVVFEIAETFR